MRVSKGASYEASKSRYVANLNGEKIVLLPNVPQTKENDDIADRLYQQKKSIATAQTTGDRSAMFAVIGYWMKWKQSRPLPMKPISGNTVTQHNALLKTFLEKYGNKPVKDLTIENIESWIAEMQSPRKHRKRIVCWSETTCQAAMKLLKQFFDWANRRGLITTSPFRGRGSDYSFSAINYNGKKTPIEPHEHLALVNYALRRSHKDFACAMILLNETGARPSEILKATAEEWNKELKAFVIKANDPANEGRFKLRRLKKDRIVYVPDEFVPLVLLLIEKYQGRLLKNKLGELKTFLFRTESDLPISYPTLNHRIASLTALINRDEKREVVRTSLSSYSYRHAYVTNWIVKGKDIYALASLLGTSVSMIEKHYSHLYAKHEVLRSHLNQFSKEQ